MRLVWYFRSKRYLDPWEKQKSISVDDAADPNALAALDSLNWFIEPAENIERGQGMLTIR
jgi:hypothetical protein